MSGRGSVSDDFLQALLDADRERDDPFALDGEDPFDGLGDGFPDGFDNCFPDGDLPGGYDLSFLDIEDPPPHGRDAELSPTTRTGDDRMASHIKGTGYATRGHVGVERRTLTVLGRPVRVGPATAEALRWAARDGAAFHSGDGKWAVVGACLSSTVITVAPQRLADAAALSPLAEHRLLRLPEGFYAEGFGTYSLSTLEKVDSRADGLNLVAANGETRPATVAISLGYGHTMPAEGLVRAVGEPLAKALGANRCFLDVGGGSYFLGVSRVMDTWMLGEADLEEFRLHAGRETSALSAALAGAADPAALAAAMALAPPALTACAVATLSDPNAGPSA